METPNNKAGKLTEKIMVNCFVPMLSANAIMKLEGATYNRVYERIYKILLEEQEAPNE